MKASDTNKIKAEKTKRIVVIVLLAAVLIGIFCYLYFIKQSHQNDVQMLDEKIQRVQADISAKQSDYRQVMQTVKKDVSGIDIVRVESDTQKVTDFLKMACTWADLDSYQKVYKSMTEMYPVDSNPGFYRFFAEPNGKTDDVNMRYIGLMQDSLIVCWISDDDVYSYFGEVVVASSAENGQEENGVFLFGCKVDADGNLSDLYAARKYE